MVRHADGGNSSTSVRSFGERRRRVKGDAGLIEPVETVVSGGLGVEDLMPRRTAVAGSPEVDETEDRFRLPALADVGVGVAEHLGIGILGETTEQREPLVGH